MGDLETITKKEADELTLTNISTISLKVVIGGILAGLSQQDYVIHLQQPILQTLQVMHLLLEF